LTPVQPNFRLIIARKSVTLKRFVLV
jgi:hypothetical protein